MACETGKCSKSVGEAILKRDFWPTQETWQLCKGHVPQSTTLCWYIFTKWYVLGLLFIQKQAGEGEGGGGGGGGGEGGEVQGLQGKVRNID